MNDEGVFAFFSLLFLRSSVDGEMSANNIYD